MFSIDETFDVLNHRLRSNNYISEPWSDILQETIASLGATQIATSTAFLVCIVYYYGGPMIDSDRAAGLFADKHMALALCQCLLAVHSQLALTSILYTPGKMYRMALIVRTSISILQLSAILILTSFSGLISFSTELGILTTTSIPVGISLVYIPMFAIQCVTLTRKLRLALTAITIYSLVWMSITLGHILSFKYHGFGGCDMNTPADNEWTLKQLFMVIMLIAPVISFIETYIGIYTYYE